MTLTGFFVSINLLIVFLYLAVCNIHPSLYSYTASYNLLSFLLAVNVSIRTTEVSFIDYPECACIGCRLFNFLLYSNSKSVVNLGDKLFDKKK